MEGLKVILANSKDQKEAIKKQSNIASNQAVRSAENILSPNSSLHDFTTTAFMNSPSLQNSEVAHYYSVQTDVTVINSLSQFITTYCNEMQTGSRGFEKVHSLLEQLYFITGFHQINEPALLASGKLYDQNGSVPIPGILSYLHCPKGTIAGTDRSTRTGVDILNWIDLAKKLPTLNSSNVQVVALGTELKFCCSSLLVPSKSDVVEKKVNLEVECGNKCINVNVNKVLDI